MPTAVWEAIALTESGLNPSATNLKDPGGSYGLFQDNRGPGGQGAGVPVKALLNPVVNAQISAPSISAAYQQAKYFGLTGNMAAMYTATHSGHPGFAPAGQLYPNPATVKPSTYQDFTQEAMKVGAAYSSITKGIGSSGGYSVTQNALAQFNALSPNPTGGLLSTQSALIGNATSSPWHTILTEVKNATSFQGAGVLHPVATAKGVMAYGAIIVLALILIVMGITPFVKETIS